MTVVFVNWIPWQQGGRPRFAPSQPDETELQSLIARADRVIFCMVDHVPNEAHLHEIHLRTALNIQTYESGRDGEIPLAVDDVVVHLRWKHHHRAYTAWTLRSPATIQPSEAAIQ